MRSWPRLAGALAGLCLLAAPGCAPPVLVASAGLSVAQAGTAAFIRGELQAAWRASLGRAWRAALEAVRELGYTPIQSSMNDRSARIGARDIRGRTVEIRLESSSRLVTKVKIRIGFFGDQAISRLVLDEIEQNLRASADAPSDATPPLYLTDPRPLGDGN